MHIPESIQGARELAPGHSFDLPLPLVRPGRLTLIATVRRLARFRVELYPPGAAHPVSFRDSDGLGLLAILECDATPSSGLWTARVLNCDTRPQYLAIVASYPGPGDLSQRNLPSHLLESIAAKLLADTNVRLLHGANASRVCFAPELNLRDFHFTLPSIDREVSPPLLPAIRVSEFVRAINSNSVRLRLLPGSVANPGGTLRLEIGFSGDGTELIGSFPIHLARMKLLIELDLGIAGHRLAYNNVRASFDFDIDIQPLPVWMYNPLFDYRDRLQHAVSTGAAEAFRDPETAESFAAGIERGLESVLGPGARAVTAQMDYGQFTLGLFRPARPAVA